MVSPPHLVHPSAGMIMITRADLITLEQHYQSVLPDHLKKSNETLTRVTVPLPQNQCAGVVLMFEFVLLLVMLVLPD